MQYSTLFFLICTIFFISVVSPQEGARPDRNRMCNSEGVCLHTWTYPIIDSNGSTVTCECQSSPNVYYQDGASCTYDRLQNGPHVKITEGYCMTFDEVSNITFMGRCPYNHLSSGPPDMLLPSSVHELNDFMCNRSEGLNHICGQQRREGRLCGKCQSGLGPAVASYIHQCVECHWYGTLLYFAYVIFPATTFCFIIILLRINLLSPPMNAIVILCHVLISYVNINPCRLFYYASVHHSYLLTLIAITIYGLLNMDFLSYVLPSFCISSKLSIFQVITIDYLVALYPLLFTALIYVLIEVHDRGFRPLVVLWSPFHRCLVRFRRSWNIKGSVISAFATLYVLSFTKVISTTVNLLLNAHLVDVCGKRHHGYLYYDASCQLFHHCHRPYGLIALAVFFGFICVPTIFLLLYPLFHLCSCHNTAYFTFIHEITKIFHHSFKDGTNDTRDQRWFAGIYLVLRIIVICSLLFRSSEQVQIISSVLGLLLVAVFQPHVYYVYNWIDSLLFGSLTAIFVLLPARQSSHIYLVLIHFIPLILIGIQLCWKCKSKAGSLLAIVCKYVCAMTGVLLKHNDAESRHQRGNTTLEECKPLLEASVTVVSHSVVDLN